MVGKRNFQSFKVSDFSSYSPFLRKLLEDVLYQNKKENTEEPSWREGGGSCRRMLKKEAKVTTVQHV